MNQLNEVEKKLLKLIIKYIGYQPFVEADVDCYSRDLLIKAEWKVGLVGLRKRIIILTFCKTWGELVYMMPKDQFIQWQRLFSKSFPSPAKFTDIEKVEGQYEYRPGLFMDLFNLLVYASKHKLQITRKGRIHKRHLHNLYTKISLKDEDLTGLDLNYEDQYSPAFAIVLDAALRLGLLQQRLDHLVVEQEKAKKWLAKTNKEMLDELYGIWSQVVVLSSIEEQYFFILMEQLIRGDWYVVEDLLHWIIQESGSCHRINQMKSLQNDLHLKCIKPLCGLGFIEVGTSTKGKLMLRFIAPVLRTEQSLYIQPDYEILVPPHFPLDILWELEHIAQYLQSDRISRYLLTKESIQSSCAQGQTIDDILTFLENHSKYELPEHVTFVVRQWGERGGIEPEAACESETNLSRKNENRDSVLFNKQGIIITNHVTSKYQQENKLPQIEDIYSGYEEIPKLWLKGLRSYHTSTKREMIEKAIEWQCYVLYMKQGMTYLMNPKILLILENNSIEVIGKVNQDEIYLSLDSLEGIKLILPGINDIY